MRISPPRKISKVTVLNTLKRRNMDFSNFDNRVYGAEIEYYKFEESVLECW